MWKLSELLAEVLLAALMLIVCAALVVAVSVGAVLAFVQSRMNPRQQTEKTSDT